MALIGFPREVNEKAARAVAGLQELKAALDAGRAEIARRLSEECREVLFLQHDVNAGAGVARMRGWPHATGRYALFFTHDRDGRNNCQRVF